MMENETQIKFFEHTLLKAEVTTLDGRQSRTSHDIVKNINCLSSYPSADLGPICIFRSSDQPEMIYSRTREYEFTARKGQVHTLYVRCCFDKRGSSYSKKTGERNYKQNPCLRPSDALSKFCRIAGLTVYNGKASALPLPLQKSNSSDKHRSKMNFFNIFAISGRFEIVDTTAFCKALVQGVGSRKSFGFGLILLDDSIENSTTSNASVIDNSNNQSDGW